jgi:hypothetical protein
MVIIIKKNLKSREHETGWQVISNIVLTILNQKDAFMKKLLLSVLAPLSLGAMELTQVHPSNVLVHHELGNAQLFHNEQGFHVQTHDGDFKQIAQYNMDKNLRQMTPEQLQAFQKAGFFMLKKLSDGEFNLNPHVRGPGGFALGAYLGSAAGFWLVQGAVYGASALAGGATTLVAGPVVGGVVASATYATIAPLAQPVAIAAAAAGGIIGGVATGPI